MDRTDALIDITYQAAKTTEGQMSQSGRLAIREIYELTMGGFARKGERQSPKIYVWDDSRFRAFIMREVKKICRAALKKADGKQVNASMVHEAAVEVMTRSQKWCDTSIKDGKLRVAHPTIRKQGEVCATYLADQTS